MVICLLAFIIFIGLVAVNFLKINKKIYIMAGLIIALLILHIADELISPTPNIEPKKLNSKHKQINITNQLYKKSPTRVLLKEERQLLNFLINKWQRKENIVTCLKDMDASRFRAIFKDFQESTKVSAVELDFQRTQYSYLQIEEALSQYNSNDMVYMLVEKVQKIKTFYDLENIYLVYNVSLILRDPNQILLPMTSLSNWMNVYQFQGNYVNQILQNHPPRLVQICSKYRTFDYSFYVLSQTQPISQLCTKLPSNRVTECVRSFMEKAEDKMALSKVRHCWRNEKNLEGLVVQNGLVGLKKEYFYSGRVDKNIFVLDPQEMQKQL